MSAIKVGLVDLGGKKLPLTLPRLAKKLNSRLKTCFFAPVESLGPERIPNPTIDHEWHDANALFDVLRSHSRFPEYDLLVGITRFKITEPDSPRDRRDYFSLSDGNRVSVISLNERVYEFRPAGKTAYQYAAFLILCELLINLAKQNLMHDLAADCLFDECEDRSDFRADMEHGTICPGCLETLKAANVGEETLKEAQLLLRWCRRHPPQYALLRAIQNPATNFVLGAALGSVFSDFLSRDQHLFVWASAAIVLVAAFMHALFSSK